MKHSFAPLVNDNCTLLILGSLDTAIRNPAVNDFATFLQEHPSINKICLNGGKAEQLFKRHCMRKNGMLHAEIESAINTRINNAPNPEVAHTTNGTINANHTEHSANREPIKIIALPSTSPANAKMCYDEKLTLWRAAILEK